MSLYMLTYKGKIVETGNKVYDRSGIEYTVLKKDYPVIELSWPSPIWNYTKMTGGASSDADFPAYPGLRWEAVPAVPQEPSETELLEKENARLTEKNEELYISNLTYQEESRHLRKQINNQIIEAAALSVEIGNLKKANTQISNTRTLEIYDLSKRITDLERLNENQAESIRYFQKNRDTVFSKKAQLRALIEDLSI